MILFDQCSTDSSSAMSASSPGVFMPKFLRGCVVIVVVGVAAAVHRQMSPPRVHGHPVSQPMYPEHASFTLEG